MTAVFVNTWTPQIEESPGWMHPLRLHEIILASNKNADGTPMVHPITYDREIYVMMRDMMVAMTDYAVAQAGLVGYTRVEGAAGVVYTVLAFSSMETLNAYDKALNSEDMYAHFKMVRDEMLSLTKVSVTINEPFETDLGLEQLKDLTEPEIKALITSPK